jgi:hypothetical protein
MLVVPGRLLTRLTFFYLLLCSNVFGQDSLTFKTQHFIALQSGYSRHIVRDDIISPIVYKGSQIPILLNYQLLAKKGQHSLSLYYDYLKLTSSISIKTPYEAFYTKNYNAFIEYSYNRKLHTFMSWNTSLFAGAGIKSLLNFRDHYFSNFTHYYSGEFIWSLDISFLIIKRFASFNNNNISFRYSMSIFAYDLLNYLYNANVAKTLSTEANHNSSFDLINTNRLVTINKYFEFQTELTYVKFINKYLGLELKHYFQYYNSEKFKNLFYTKYVNNQYLVGLIVKI